MPIDRAMIWLQYQFELSSATSPEEEAVAAPGDGPLDPALQAQMDESGLKNHAPRSNTFASGLLVLALGVGAGMYFFDGSSNQAQFDGVYGKCQIKHQGGQTFVATCSTPADLVIALTEFAQKTNKMISKVDTAFRAH